MKKFIEVHEDDEGASYSAQLSTILEGGCTDSDLEDFAHENNLDEGDVFRFAAEYRVKGTPCEGCKNCGLFPNMYPCTSCSRSKRDFYNK